MIRSIDAVNNNTRYAYLGHIFPRFWVLNNPLKKLIGKLTQNIVLKFTWEHRLIQTAAKQLTLLLAKYKDPNKDWSHESVTLNYLYSSNTEIHLRTERNIFFFFRKETAKLNPPQSQKLMTIFKLLLYIPETHAKLKMKKMKQIKP